MAVAAARSIPRPAKWSPTLRIPKRLERLHLHHQDPPGPSDNVRILSVIDPSPVRPQQKVKKSSSEVPPAREELVITIDDEESEEETTFHKTDLTNFSSTSATSSRPTSFKRQLPDLSDHALGTDESRNKSQKSRNEVAREEVEDDVDDEESDEEKYSHNSRTCRALIRKLEGEGWYKRLDGRGHSLTALLVMEKAHLKSLNRPGRERFA